MKRFKFYVVMSLIVCMLTAYCPAAFADGEFAGDDVNGFVYGYDNGVSDYVYDGGVGDYVYDYDYGVSDYVYDYSVSDYVYGSDCGVADYVYGYDYGVSDYVYGFQSDYLESSPIAVTVKGSTVVFDQPPVAKQGRTLVPVRAIFEALGATVDWDNATQTVSARRENVTVILTLGSNIMTVDGMGVELDVPAEAINGRTLVPVRAISEAFGCNVEWEQATRTVIIN